MKRYFLLLVWGIVLLVGCGTNKSLQTAIDGTWQSPRDSSGSEWTFIVNQPKAELLVTNESEGAVLEGAVFKGELDTSKRLISVTEGQTIKLISGETFYATLEMDLEDLGLNYQAGSRVRYSLSSDGNRLSLYLEGGRVDFTKNP